MITRPIPCLSIPMSKILSYLFLGSRKDAKNRQWLQQNKIVYILNMTPSRDVDPIAGVPNFFKKEGKFRYARIPMFDNAGENLLKHLSKAFEFIEQGRHYGNVFVHCKKGISRSVSIVLAYLMKHKRLTLEESLRFLESKRAEVRVLLLVLCGLRTLISFHHRLSRIPHF